MSTNKRQVLIRVQPSHYEKLKILSNQNHRSVSNQIEWLILRHITEYEAEHGTITPPTQDKANGVVQSNVMGNNVIGNNTLIAVDDGKSYVSIT